MELGSLFFPKTFHNIVEGFGETQRTKFHLSLLTLITNSWYFTKFENFLIYICSVNSALHCSFTKYATIGKISLKRIYGLGYCRIITLSAYQTEVWINPWSKRSSIASGPWALLGPWWWRRRHLRTASFILVRFNHIIHIHIFAQFPLWHLIDPFVLGWQHLN